MKWQNIFIPRKLWHAIQIELSTFAALLKYGLPNAMLQFGGGIGDELLLTAVARELKKRKPLLRIWQVSQSMELLLNNPDYDRVFTMEHWPLRYALLLESRRCRLSYAIEELPRVKEIPPKRHIIAELCGKAGIRGPVAIRPYLYLTETERKTGRLAQRQIAIQCIGDGAYVTIMRNKLWFPDRFQSVVDEIRAKEGDNLRIIQLGSTEDALLNGVTDLRGKTSMRETAAILANSDCFIGTVGFLMHLSRAVECRSVIIYGGREHSSQTGYICNENLNTHTDCSPCWLWNDCAYARKCMKIIAPDDVMTAVNRSLARRGEPFETEVVTL